MSGTSLLAPRSPRHGISPVRRHGLVWAAAVALSLTLAGCGVRGSLENPQGSDSKQKATADSGQGKKEGEAPKPHKDFVLDGLIR